MTCRAVCARRERTSRLLTSQRRTIQPGIRPSRIHLPPSFSLAGPDRLRGDRTAPSSVRLRYCYGSPYGFGSREPGPPPAKHGGDASGCGWFVVLGRGLVDRGAPAPDSTVRSSSSAPLSSSQPQNRRSFPRSSASVPQIVSTPSSRHRLTCVVSPVAITEYGSLHPARAGSALSLRARYARR